MKASIVPSAAVLGLAAVASACVGDDFGSSTGINIPTSGTGGSTGLDTFPPTDDDDDDTTTGDNTSGSGADETASPDDTGEAECGNDMVEGNEVCDGTDLDGEDCSSQGFDDGDLACDAACGGFDVSGCVSYECGNDEVEGREVCDGTDVGDQDCGTQGYDGGTLGCAKDCSDYDVSSCFLFTCGNDNVEGREVCDGTDLADQTCVLEGFDGGDLACNDRCDAYDTSGCTTCGDSVREGDEVCDGPDLDGQTCVDEGFGDGVLGCNDDCSAFDTDGCNTCGNAMVEGFEVCDGPDLDGQTCVGLGFFSGSLACAGTCDAFDISSCCVGEDIGESVGAAVASGTNVGGGDDSVGVCDGSAGEDVIYLWTAPATQTFTLDTLGSDYDTVLYVVDDCGGNELACNDEAFSTSQSSVELDAVAGTTYVVVVDGWDGASGNHVLNITESFGQCIDEPLAQGIGPSVASGSNAGAGNDYGLVPCTFTAGEDVAHSWIAPSTGHYQFDTIGSTYNTVLGLVDQCGGGQLSCDSQSGGGSGQSLLVYPVTEGVPYIVVVDGLNNATGSYELNIFPTIDPCNDADLGAAVGAGIGTGTNLGAADDSQPTCTATTGEDFAFQWTAPSTDNFVIDTFGSDFDTVLYVLDGCGGMPLVCNNQSGGTDQSSVTLAATQGDTYSIVVDGWGETGNIVLSIRPLSEMCVDEAADGQLGTIASGTNLGAGNDEQTGCTGTAGEDVVLEWVAPASGTYTADTFGSTFDTVLEVRSSCGTDITCNDQANGVGPESELSFSAIAGNSYLFVVDGWNGATGSYQLNINGPY